MSSESEILALRRQVLVMRASLQRLRLARDAMAVRESLSTPFVRVARVVRIVGLVASIVQVSRALFRTRR